MQVLDWQSFTQNPPAHSLAVTIGAFDGIHRGHQALIDAVNRSARNETRFPAVVTFRENPKKVLYPARFRGSLMTLEDKLAMFESMGIAYCVLIDFSGKFATLSGREFLSALYVANVRSVVVGENFQFGHRHDSNAAMLESLAREMGIEPYVLPSVLYRGRPVSSSRIRHAIEEGNLADAAAMLGRPYCIAARRTALEKGSQLLIPEDDLVLPPDGIYLVDVFEGGETVRCNLRIAGRTAECGIRMRSDRIVAAFVDTATQE